MEQEGNIWSAGTKKNGGGKGGQYLEKENKENIWRRKIVFFVEEKKNREGKYRKYLEKGNIFLQRRRKTEKEGEENIL